VDARETGDVRSNTKGAAEGTTSKLSLVFAKKGVRCVRVPVHQTSTYNGFLTPLRSRAGSLALPNDILRGNKCFFESPALPHKFISLLFFFVVPYTPFCVPPTSHRTSIRTGACIGTGTRYQALAPVSAPAALPEVQSHPAQDAHASVHLRRRGC
jgi:hypothetical protein